MAFKGLLTRALALFSVITVGLGSALAQSNQAVYTDSLQNGWENWSWATVNFANNSPARSGSSIRVDVDQWEAIYLHHAAQDARNFTNLTFWIHGGATGGQQLLVRATLNGSEQAAYMLPALTANTWQQITVPLSGLGVASSSDFDGFWIQDAIGATQPAFYLDDITLIGGTPPPPTTNQIVSVTVDAGRDRKPISDLIYGVAFASSNQLKELNAPLHRSGGNPESRYNWQQNASNRGFDWYFQSVPDESPEAGGAGDRFVRDSKAAQAEAMLTIPNLGWVAKLGPGRQKLASYSIAKYGAQTDRDSTWFPDAGNGILSGGTLITWNDPNDANVLVDSNFQQDWVRHLTNRWGASTNGGVRYYIMDNEPSLWHSTHRDVHPVGATMREVRDKFFEYAEKVKAVDPNALIVAPEEWGWSGYFMSGYDQQWGAQHNNWSNLPDRGTNGGWHYLPWFLDQVRQRATNTNKRLLDIFSVHYYPQGGEFNPQNEDLSPSMQLRRNRSTRSLWDTNYTDQSWIADKVMLIPRLKNWVSTYYPGTPIAITEYNWGAENHINGATAQADIYGIFGREGLDMAARWTTPVTNSPTYKAMKMYRNYDGNMSTFGNLSVSASGPDPDRVSCFAAVRTNDSALTVMLINKQLEGNQPFSLNLTNHTHLGTAEVWQLTSSNVIQRLPDLQLQGNTVTNSVPPQSITLLVVHSPPLLTLKATQPPGSNVSVAVRASHAPRTGVYVVETSSDLVTWTAVQTNIATVTNWGLELSVTNRAHHFLRAKWQR